MKVLLAGSLRLEYLNPEVHEILESWMADNAHFLVGDAPGIDRSFQKFLNAHRYPDVTVYCSDGRIRTNLGEWEVFSVPSGLKSTGHARHAAKDRQMVDDAESGLMVWDSMSTGTIANVLDLVDAGKPCHLFIEGSTKAHHYITASSDTDDVAADYPEVFEKAAGRLQASRKRHNVMASHRESVLDVDWSSY